MSMRTRCALGAALIMLSMLATSCMSGPQPTESEPALGPEVTVQKATDLVLPLDAYRLSQKEYVAVRRAAWRLVRDCVHRFGAEYTLPESLILADVPTLVFTNERRYGLFDPESAAVYGYKPRPEDMNTADKSPDKGSGWNPSETEKLLVRGATDGVSAPKDTAGNLLPSGGCTGESDRLLAEGAAQPPDENLAAKLSVEAHQRSERDSRVRDAMARWSDCMKQGGRSYQTIWEPNDKKWPEPVDTEQITTAKADIACKKEVGLVELWFRVDTAYQKRIVEQRAEDLRLAQDYIRATARNAALIVGSG